MPAYLPLIYADMNIFRYIACGNLQIKNPQDFHWVYSYVHLDEIARNGNQDALEGMRILNAVEICDVLNAQFQSVGDIFIKDFIDPQERYAKHLEAISGYDDAATLPNEFLLRIFGADNFDELQASPDHLKRLIENLAQGQSLAIRDELLQRADSVSKDLEAAIKTHLDKTLPIDATRMALGLTSSKRKEAEQAENPIEELWRFIQPAISGQTKNEFFGLEQQPEMAAFAHPQHVKMGSMHTVLNLLGLHPDKGLSKRDKIQNILCDGRHLGFASYCNALLSADNAICDKAKAIYKDSGTHTNVIHLNLSLGSEIELGII